jgi:hypothetical protein
VLLLRLLLMRWLLLLRGQQRCGDWCANLQLLLLLLVLWVLRVACCLSRCR